MEFTIVIPAKNESSGLSSVLPELKKLPAKQIIVVNDGSTDNTKEVCEAFGVTVLSHPYSKGNGAAIKTGLRAATTEYILFMDADGQHTVKGLQPLLDQASDEFDIDMVVGVRSFEDQANFSRGVANTIYNWFASKMVGQSIPDLTSGLRLVNRVKMLEFIHLLPNGFSYPTTITMAFFRAGYNVSYVNVEVKKRIGKSHIRPIADGVRFLLIIFKVASLYSPLKIFFPTSMLLFFLGLGYYLFTYFSDGRFTNMGMLMFTTSMVVFLMGLISEQIAALNYQKK